jgi:Ca-activated chloride channel family protein
MAWRICLAVAVLSWTTIGVASSAQIAPPILSIRTELVTVAVTVMDRHGVVVTGLGPEHFSVYDDGARRPIEFFSAEEVPATIGLLVDSSASMHGRGNGIGAAAEALAALRHPSDEFFTLNFNETVWPGLPPGVAFTRDVIELRAALAAAPARGLTALYDAVAQGLGHVRHGTWARKALIVVSDGGDNASTLTLRAVLSEARRGDAVIYAVSFHDPDNRDARPEVLKKLTRETGGRAFKVAGTGEAMQAFARIADEIRHVYTIGFAPEETGRRGFRPIRVAVHARDRGTLTAHARAGYYAGPSAAAIR